MEKIQITSKGALQLPYALREKYSFLDGGVALLLEQPDGILIKKIEANFFDSFLGKYATALPTREELQIWSTTEISADEAQIKALP